MLKKISIKNISEGLKFRGLQVFISKISTGSAPLPWEYFTIVALIYPEKFF